MKKKKSEIDNTTEAAIGMIKEMNQKGGCEACMHQVIKALSIIKDSHNTDACSRDRAYRCYEFHNQRLEKKIRALL